MIQFKRMMIISTIIFALSAPATTYPQQQSDLSEMEPITFSDQGFRPTQTEERVSYALGVQVARQMQMAGNRLDTHAFEQGVADVMEGNRIGMTEAQMESHLEAYRLVLESESARLADEIAELKAERDRTARELRKISNESSSSSSSSSSTKNKEESQKPTIFDAKIEVEVTDLRIGRNSISCYFNVQNRSQYDLDSWRLRVKYIGSGSVVATETISGSHFGAGDQTTESGYEYYDGRAGNIRVEVEVESVYVRDSSDKRWEVGDRFDVSLRQ